MNKLIAATFVSIPLFLLEGCATSVRTVAVDNVVYDPGYTVAYDPGYRTNYIYSVGYYYNRPYWGNDYYYYNDGYWGGLFYNGY